MVDIDMAPSRFARKSFVHLANRKKLDPAENRVYILPALEVKENNKMPETRTEVIQRWQQDVRPFHDWCDICYKKSQDYNRWIHIDEELDGAPADSQVNTAYDIKYHLPFEPYYIAGSLSDLPLYDERFRGYGYNKVEQCYEMSLKNWTFTSLDSQFISHNGWKSATTDSTVKTYQQQVNEQHFNNFKKELKIGLGLTHHHSHKTKEKEGKVEKFFPHSKLVADKK